MDKDFLDNHPALQVIRENVEDNAEEENEQVQVGWKVGLFRQNILLYFFDVILHFLID